LLASFLATSIIFALWQQLRHDAPIKTSRAIGWLALTLLHVFIVFKSGSRVGIFGLSAAMLLLGIWIHWYSPQNKRFGWLCLTSLLLAALLTAWLGNVVERVWDVFQGHSTTYRLSFIQASTHLWWQSPWWGHGVGTFSEKIVPAYVQLIEAGNSLYYTPNLGHPHNEVLLWAVETGAIGVLGIVGPWVFVMVWLSLQQSWNSLAWVACLLPITLHQLTEFPFHSSTAHIWLWCMVLASGMPSPAWRKVHGAAPAWIQKVSITAICALFIGAAWVLVDTGWVSHQAWKHRPGWVQWGQTHLSPPKEREFDHPIFKTFATDQFNILIIPKHIHATENSPIHGLCDGILEMGKRWQNPTQWALEKECLLHRHDDSATALLERKVKALTKSP
jgi:O-antigen polymerase